MLKMKPNCESCDKDLPPDSAEAMICSFECTFCHACITRRFSGECPNCGGMHSPRPTRVGAALERNPASEQRVRSHYEITVVDGVKQIKRTRQ